MSRSSRPNAKHINLALQGGGAHGAFTWGVLDRLLEDDRLRIEAISGTSAGAMNAVVVADGIMEGDHEGARACLRRFWKAVSDAGKKSPIQRSPIDVFMGNWSLDASPSYLFFDLRYPFNCFSYPFLSFGFPFNDLTSPFKDCCNRLTLYPIH